jgi:hypothetical protein
MRNYRFIALPIVLLLLLFAPSSTVSAGIGTGIGVSFPISHSGSSTPTSTYAAFRSGKIVQELTVQERHGRLMLELKVTNSGDTAYTIPHRDGQSYDFAVLDKNNKELYRWSNGMAFTQALTSSSIAAHSSEVYTAELDSRTYRKIKEDAVLVTAWLTDTPYVLSTKVPTPAAASATPVVIHGGIILGNGDWSYGD